MAESAYELLQPGDLPFFEISDSSSFMVMKLNSDNPNAVWFMGHEKIEESFERFIWNLYYDDPSYLLPNVALPTVLSRETFKPSALDTIKKNQPLKELNEVER